MFTSIIKDSHPSPSYRAIRPVARILLACGIASSLLYVAMNVFIAKRWNGYSSISQTVSELSAIGAPTRSQWVAFGIVYTLLILAFGYGVWRFGRGNRPQRVAGGLLVAYGAVSLVWPFAPMHLRGVETTFSDTLHIALGMLTVVLMLLTMGFSAAAYGKRFRLYTVLSVAAFVVFGALTALEAPGIAANLPTPWIGLWERINIGVFMLWVVVLAVRVIASTDDEEADDLKRVISELDYTHSRDIRILQLAQSYKLPDSFLTRCNNI